MSFHLPSVAGPDDRRRVVPRPSRRLAGLSAIALGVLLVGQPAAGQGAGGAKLSFDRDIRPILSENCYACHGPDAKKRKADLRLDRKDDAFRDRDGSAVIVPGDVEASELVERIRSDDPDEVMPPRKSRKTLKP